MSGWLQLLFAVLAFVSVTVRAAPADVVDELRELPAPSVRMKQIDAAARSSFEAALAEYDEQLAQYPYDIMDRLQRCRFIDQAISYYEYAGFIDEVMAEADKCRAALVEKHAEHPEVALWQLESSFGEQLLSKGTELLRNTAAGTWTTGQSARLYTMLARAADLSEKRDLALQYALKALDLDETSDVRLIAATHLIALGDKTRALEILATPVRKEQGQESWSLAKKMSLLAQLDASQQVISLHSQLRELSDYDHTDVARTLRAVGANDLARQELTLATEGSSQFGTEAERELFRFELELGSAQQALAAYEAWRKSGWLQDPLGINRFALFLKDSSLPWQPRDVAGLFGFLGAFCTIVLLCAVPIAGVHYRGLAVRARSLQPYPTDGWRLRHGWIALCCMGLASLFALYSAGAIDLTATNAGGWAIDATNQQLGRIALIESLLTILLLIPFGILAVARESLWRDEEWTVAKSCIVALGLALVFRLPLLLAWYASPDAIDQVALDDALWQMIGAVRDQYGVVTALWIVAVAAPVVEEFVFRGVLLRSFSTHIRPGWANVVQAALFSAMHMNFRAALLLFVFGLVLGGLARRSGSLLAPIIMHAAFNLIAALILL